MAAASARLSRTSQQVWFAIIATLMAGIAPVMLISSTPLNDGSSPAWIPAYIFVIVVGLRFAWVVATQPQRLFEVVFWLFTYVFMGLAPIAQLRSGRYPSTISFVDTSLNVETVAAVAIGTAAFCVGLAIAGQRRKGPRRAYRVPRTNPYRLQILCFFSILFTLLYIHKVGVGVLLGNRLHRSNVEADIYGPLITAIVNASATLPLIICFAGLIRWRRERKRQGLRGPIFLPFVVFVLMAIVLSPTSIPRYYFGTAIIAVLASLGATSTPLRARLFALLLAFGLVIVFPFAAASRTPERLTLADLGGPAQVLTTADFDAFDQLNNGIAYVDQNGAQNGQQLAGAVLFAVPRMFWENKPIDTGILLAQYRDYDEENLSAPIWAEFFVDGGWGFLIIGMAGLGYLLRRLDLRAALDRGAGGTALLITLPFYLVIILRGSLLQSMAGFSVLVLTGLFITTRKPLRNSIDAASP